MTNQPNPTRVVTGEVRFSFVSLLKPRENQYGGEAKYSVTILLPKSDIQTKQRIDAAIQAAIQKGKEGSWNGIVPPNVAIPIHDGDGVKPGDGLPFGPECKGHWVFTASTGIDYPPKIVDANANPIIDPTEIYSGMYGRIAINFSPYSFAGKKGVGCYISTNVQKTRDGEPLGSTAPAAADDFGGGQAYPPQQPMYGQPPVNPSQQQPQINMPYGMQPQQPQPGQWNQQQAPYQQPQQGYGQAPQQPQIDPITGQPINGGVYGL